MANYYQINIRVSIARNTFDSVHSIKVDSDSKKFADTATITLPRIQSLIADKDLTAYFPIGSEVEIEAGYNGQYNSEFKGYLTEIGADIPLKLTCEDEMYKLKKLPKINRNYKAVTLKALLEDITPYSIEAVDMNLGKFLIENASPYKVLEQLKKDYSIHCFFQGDVLRAGLPVDLETGEAYDFVFGENIRKSSSLKYLTKENRSRYYTGISHQKGSSKKIKFSFGDQDGEQRTLHLPIGLTQAEVQDWVKKTYESHSQGGYEGNLDSWAYPQTKAGDIAEIKDPNYPDGHRDKSVYISGVATSIDASNGIKRVNQLSLGL